MEHKNIQKVVIVSGQWSANGNFSGYDVLGAERYHIPARMMASLGYKKDDVVTFPLYASVVQKSYAPRLDANGNPIPNADGSIGIKDRPTVTSLFTTKQAGIDAFVDSTSFARDVNIALKAAESAAGISASSVSELESLG